MQAPRHYSDEELIVLIQSPHGIDEAVRYMYGQYLEFLGIYVQQHGGSAEDAQDIFQEVVVAFIHLVQQNKFRGESSIKTFLFALNRNIWLNELKKRKRSTIREIKFEEMKPVEEAGIAEYISAREGTRELMDIIARLGEVCQQILFAFYYRDLSIKEILEQLHYENEQVVRNKKHKCMKKLDELLQANPLLAKNLKTILRYEQ
jgi:RNA polymerase sigma factor (sigma-70 family)